MTHWNTYRSALPPSSQMYPLIGLNLLRLLSQNRLSDFHTALETIDLDQLQTNQFIKQAVDLGKSSNQKTTHTHYARVN